MVTKGSLSTAVAFGLQATFTFTLTHGTVFFRAGNGLHDGHVTPGKPAPRTMTFLRNLR